MNKPKQNTIDAKKQRIFTVILILLPFLLLFLLEAGLWIFNYGGNQKLFVTGPAEGIQQYYMSNRNVSKRYFYMLDTKPTPSKDLFLKKKPENGYRIFVIGGSTTAGFPYANNMMFSRIMHKQLESYFPDKHIEVVNTAMSAVNSYTLVDFMDEILEQKPDALLIYAGHNEYYGAMGVGSAESWGKKASNVRTYMKLRKYKTFLLVRDIVGKMRLSVMKKKTGGTMMDPTSTLMARIVAEQTIPYKSELYNSGKTQFEENLEIIFQKAAKKNVPILISDLVSNIADQKPFVSVEADTFPNADKAFEIGKKLQSQGNYDDARQALTLAKDLDALRFRASEEINDIIHAVAAEYNTPVVPMKSVFEKHSENGLAGNNLFLEHLHPNYNGYFIMAQTFLQTMKQNHFISDTWPQELTSIKEIEANWGFSDLDIATANVNIQFLKGGWPFQPKGLPNRMLDNYTATTKAESMAVKILTQPYYSIELGHYDLGTYYMNKKEWEKAAKEWKALYYIIPFELEFYEKAAECQLMLKNHEKALTILEIAVNYGTSPFIDEWYGKLLVSHGDVGKALPYLQRASERNPEDVNTLSALVHSYNVHGEKDKAKEIYDRVEAIKQQQQPTLDPQSKEGQKVLLYNALLDQAHKYLQAKEYDKAYGLLYRANQAQESALTTRWLGFISLKRGNLDNGIPYLEKALQFTPSDFEILYNLCHAYIKTNQKAKADKLMQRMEKIRPDFNDPQDLRTKFSELDGE